MTDPNTATVTFDTPIKRGETTIGSVVLRRPKGGQLRGATITDLLQMEAGAVAKVVPRISDPAITEHEVLGLEAGDITDLAMAVSSFLLPTRLKADFPTT